MWDLDFYSEVLLFVVSKCHFLLEEFAFLFHVAIPMN